MWGIVQNKISYYIPYVKNIVIYMYEHVNIHIHIHTCIHTYLEAIITHVHRIHFMATTAPYDTSFLLPLPLAATFRVAEPSVCLLGGSVSAPLLPAAVLFFLCLLSTCMLPPFVSTPLFWSLGCLSLCGNNFDVLTTAGNLPSSRTGELSRNSPLGLSKTMGAQAKSNDFSPNCILVPAEGIWLITFIVALETCRWLASCAW